MTKINTMKLIVFHPHGTVSSAAGYARSIRIAYMLSIPVVSAGLSEQDYKLFEYKKDLTIEERIKYLLKCYPPGEDRDNTLEVERTVKIFKSAKNKSSKLLIMMEKMKKYQNQSYCNYIDFRYNVYNKHYKFEAMAGFFDTQKFHSYYLESDAVPRQSKNALTKLQLLQLQLRGEQDKNTIFFLDRHKIEGTPDILLYDAGSLVADDPELTYVQCGILIPMLETMTANEIAHARTHLDEPMRELREKLDQWITVCYQSPNTTAGLEFFRKDLNKYIPTIENVAIESPVLKNISKQTRKKSQSYVAFGQAPIERIWRYYHETNAITEDEYQKLLQIKKDQYPKYEGRWPVAFISFIVDDLNPDHFETQLSTRKMISLDSEPDESKKAPKLKSPALSLRIFKWISSIVNPGNSVIPPRATMRISNTSK